MEKKARLFSIFRYVLLLGLGLLLLYLAFKGQDLNRIASDLRHADYFWVGASLLMILVAHIFRAIRWRMLINPLGFRPGLGNTYHAVIIGYLANLALPRMGEVTRCGVLNRTEKIPVNALIGTVITERLIDVFCLVFVTALSVLLKFDLISGFIYQRVRGIFA
ncbi:MAG TPA: lysylphosphatidylglycerol synthase transmembrane domain-containing protein, partial [Anseongella sp.]|nr:lysylphosphatidylglycerol synthase transmembrane domain-containing protein [Anseongella sp.]